MWLWLRSRALTGIITLFFGFILRNEQILAKVIFPSNKIWLYLRLVGGLVTALVLIARPGLIYANGGGTLLVDRVGAYELVVSASPYPPEVGENDISTLVGRLSDAEVELDAQVIMIIEPLDQAGEPQTYSATHANATNKLYYAANIAFPTPGRWKLTVQVDGPEGLASTAFEIEVMPGSPFSSLPYLELGGLAIVGLLVFLLVVLNRRPEKEFNGDLEDGQQ